MNDKIYFKNLDGLRSIAAFFVIIHHVDENLIILGHTKPSAFHFPILFGPLAVRFFFVLSGFLITYLLLQEKENTKTIRLKAFYMRRVLRIWPVYYLVVILALFVLPYTAFFDIPPYLHALQKYYMLKIALLFFVVPNVLLAVKTCYNLPYADQTWSIGVEEQFYLLWPLIIKKTRNHLPVFLTIIFVFFVLTNDFVLDCLNIFIKFHFINEFSGLYRAGIAVNNFLSGWANFQIDSMAIGAVGSYLVFYQKQTVLNALFNKTFTRILLVVFLASLVIFQHGGGHQYFSVIFLIFILNLAQNPANRLNLEFKPLKYIGKISYGIYMLHPIAVTIAIKSIYALHLSLKNVMLQLCTYGVTVVVSIAMASVSYYLIEKRFLRLKGRYLT